jgi:hypothetical protein
MDGYEVDSYGLEYGQMMDPCGQVDENWELIKAGSLLTSWAI